MQTQKTGVEQWDKMEILIENVKKNKDNKDYLNLLYEKIQKLKIKEEQQERYGVRIDFGHESVEML